MDRVSVSQRSVPLSSVTMSMAEFDFPVSFLQGLYLAKMSILPILVDHGWIISVTVNEQQLDTLSVRSIVRNWA